MNATVEMAAAKTYGALLGAAKWAWSEKPFIVAALGASVVFCQAAGLTVPHWLVGACAVAGCGGYGYLHYVTR